MSDVLLFVYPDKRYFESEAEDITFAWGSSKAVPYVLSYFDKLIEGRYRSRGYQVFWLILGQEEDRRVPDCTWISPAVTIQAEDTTISAGITSVDLMEGNMRADNEYVRSQLPEDIDRLVVAGFHLYDCVDKVAEYFYNKTAVDVMVDFDLSHLMPGWLACRQVLPLHRCDFTPEAFTPGGSWLQEDLREMWTVEKPWHRQRRMYEVCQEELESQEIPRTNLELTRESAVGTWQSSDSKHSAYFTSIDSRVSYGKVMLLNGQVLALSYHDVPFDADPGTTDKLIHLEEFADEHEAADWLEQLTAKYPRERFKPRAEAG